MPVTLPIFVQAMLGVSLVSAVSFIGLLSLSLNKARLTSILLYLVSFAAGALMGDVFFHILPETNGGVLTVPLAASVIAGIVLSLIIEKIIHWRHCHMPETANHMHPLAFMNLVGDGVHNFLDGLIIAAAFLTGIPTGIATTIAVILHEIPQEIGDFGVLLHAGLSVKRALFYNVLTALAAVLGTLVTLYFASLFSSIDDYLACFAAGGFIYIAGSDLIPELHKEESGRKGIFQILAFTGGVAIMALMLLIG